MKSLSYLAFLVLVAAQSSAAETRLPLVVQRALACLTVDRRGPPGILDGRLIRLRFTRGSIPGWPRSSNGDILNIALYNERDDRAVLLFVAIEEDDSETVLDNSYLLERNKDGWAATEGNGGLETHRLISRFGATLARSPVHIVERAALSPKNPCHYDGR